MQTKKNNQQHIIVRARCTGQFIVYLATFTFQNIQNYLYKLSGKRLSGKHLSRKVIVREMSVRESSCPVKVLSGKRLVRETSVRESDCPGNVRYPHIV